MKGLRFALILTLLIAAGAFAAPPSQTAARQGGWCALIDVVLEAPAGGGMGEGTIVYLEAGTKVHYFVQYNGTDAGVGFDVYGGDFPPPGEEYPGDVFADGSPNGLLDGVWTVPADGWYAIGAGGGGPESSGGTVTVLVEWDCGITDPLCELIGTADGYPMATGFETTLEAGTIVSVIATQADPSCWIEFGVHGPNGFQSENVGGGGGVGSASTQVVIFETGLYGFGIGPTEGDGCFESGTTITAYAGCTIEEATAAVAAAPAPGCDVRVTIPESAVVGSFVTDATLYYAPGSMVAPETVIEAGNTAYVLGTDASGAYYKILWVCKYYWVPVSSMGPNYDEVWNGMPLPSQVVD